MNKNSYEFKSNIIIICILALASIFTIIFLALTGNNNEVFYDVIVENLALLSTNKTNERFLIYFLIFSGVILYSLLHRFYISKTSIFKDNKQSSLNIYIFGTVLLVRFLFFSDIQPQLVSAVLLIVILGIFSKEKVEDGTILFFSILYSLYSIYRIYVFVGGSRDVSLLLLSIITFAVTSIIIFLKYNITNKVILICQCIIPFLFTIYFANSYIYNGSVVVINQTLRIIIIVSIIVLSFTYLSVKKLLKYWKSSDFNFESLSYGTIVSIMAFNCYSGTGAIITTDIHHPYENIIGFSQVFELGQRLFTDYIPVSGMYSIVHGAFFKLFGNGTMDNYYSSDNIFFLFIILIIVGIMWRRVDHKYLFIISLLFVVTDYDRIAFILPTMLILSDRNIINNENKWLVVWFITSLFQGLYYPVYGAAVCLAFLPLGIKQIYTFISSKRLKNDVKTLKFWTPWAFCFLLLVISFPWLIGTFNHIKLLGGQTEYADGLSRFGQVIPEYFLSFLDDNSFIKIALFYILSFVFLALIVWIAYAMFLKYKKTDTNNAFIFLSAAIAPVICYSSTAVRLDFNNIYARSYGVITAVSVLLLLELFVLREQGKYMSKLFLILTIAVFTLSDYTGMLRTDLKLQANYYVPDGYVYVNNDKVEKWGNGFVEKEEYETVSEYYDAFKDRDKSLSYIGNPMYFGYYYLCDIKGDGPIELINTPKGYGAVKETVDIARNNYSIMGSLFYPDQTYYVYNYLMTSGEYVWDASGNQFVPNVFGYDSDAIRQINNTSTVSWDNYNLGKTASSLGSSIETISDVFENCEVNYSLENEGNGLCLLFDKSIDGNDADYLYVEFEGLANNYNYSMFSNEGYTRMQPGNLSKYLMIKEYNPDIYVIIMWLDEDDNYHNMYCDMGEGKLLIPLGAGVKWLLNNHDRIYVNVVNNGIVSNEIVISDIEFLKLREVR